MIPTWDDIEKDAKREVFLVMNGSEARELYSLLGYTKLVELDKKKTDELDEVISSDKVETYELIMQQIAEQLI